MSTPTLLESIQHVFIRKVAVNSGGKHCLALSSEGEVYSWGEAEDGKLGHGNRRCGENGKRLRYRDVRGWWELQFSNLPAGVTVCPSRREETGVHFIYLFV